MNHSSNDVKVTSPNQLFTQYYVTRCLWRWWSRTWPSPPTQCCPTSFWSQCSPAWSTEPWRKTLWWRVAGLYLYTLTKAKNKTIYPFSFQWDCACRCAPHEERTTGPAAGIVFVSHVKKYFTILPARAWPQWTQAPATPWQTWSLALWRNLQHNQRAGWHFRWIDNPKSLLQWCHSCSRRWLLTTHCWPDLAPLINGWRDLNIHSLKTSSTSWNTHIIHNIC